MTEMTETTERFDRVFAGPVPGATMSVRVWDGGRRWQDTQPADTLVERDVELNLLRQLVSGLDHGRPAVVVVEGEPGTGRSALLAQACAMAVRRGFRAVYAQGSPDEADLRHGVVSQLLGALVPVNCPLWTRPTWTDPALDAELVPLLCRDFAAVARDRPLLLVVDDAHWADPGSLGWLRAMERRLRGVPLMILVAANSHATACAGDVAAVPDPDDGVARHHIRLAPLSPDGVRAALTIGVGRAAGVLTDAFVDAAVHATGGNPGLLGEVRRRFGPCGPPTDTAHIADLVATVELARGDRAVRLAATLPDELSRLLRALAVGAGRLGLPLVALLADVRTRSEHAALALLSGMGLAHERDGVWLVAPSVRDRVLAVLPLADREELVRRAAELGHRVAADDEVVADLLTRARPTGRPWVVDVLRAAAFRAVDEDRPYDAVRFLQRALREPLEERRRAELLFELSAVSPPTAEPGDAERHLSQVLTGPGGADLTELRLRAADLLLASGRSEQARRDLSGVLGRTDADPAEFASLYQLADSGGFGTPVGLREPDVVAPPISATEQGSLTELGSLTESGGLTELGGLTDPVRCAVVAGRLAAAGEQRGRAVELARRVLAAGGLLAPRVRAAFVLSVADEADEALSGVDRIFADATGRAAPAVLAGLLSARADFAMRAGRPAVAEQDSARAARLLPLADWPPALSPRLVSTRVALCIEAGDLGEAERLLACLVEQLPRSAVDSAAWDRLLFVRGWLWLSLGNAASARADLLECGWRLSSRLRTNPALRPWRSLAALACQALGDDEDSARLIAEERARAAAWGAPGAVRFASAVSGLLVANTVAQRTAVPATDPSRTPDEPAQRSVVLVRRLVPVRADDDGGGAPPLR
jgi:hypothetical protein